MHGLLLDANLSRGLARSLAAKGNRVVLLDLLGHGRSDKPRHAGPHRMDLYAEQVLCLLDELGADQVVLGGVSLGTNVSLLATVQAPDRVRGLVLEMPVLESAAPAAALVFAPLLLEVHYARAVLRLVSRIASRLPSSRLGPVDSFISSAASDPDETAAVLHGVLLGPIAPTIDQRRAITAPALVLTVSGRMTNRGTEPKSHEVTGACWWRRAAARSSARPDSMPSASTSRSGVAAKSPVIPKVTVPQ